VRVLAVDTTSRRGSLAVADAGEIVAEARVVSEAGHSRWLLGAVDALLRGLGIAAGEIDLFAVTTGPGSFTGLRVGLGSVQGLGLAARRPCLGVSTLDVVAAQVRGQADATVALLEAHRGEVFWAVYGREATLAGERRVGGLAEALAAAPAGSAFAGDAVAGRRHAIADAVAGARFPETSGFLASALARLALGRAHEARPASELRPLYLRGVAIRPSRA
jgi:tRNA threonylcarbamoyladenosine biosynthesis protein TsaB